MRECNIEELKFKGISIAHGSKALTIKTENSRINPTTARLLFRLHGKGNSVPDYTLYGGVDEGIEEGEAFAVQLVGKMGPWPLYQSWVEIFGFPDQPKSSDIALKQTRIKL
jgi:hypothetical protein